MLRGRTRIWHFVVVPPMGMAVLLLGFRLVDRLVVPSLAGESLAFYNVVRAVVIVLLMSFLIAILAVRYRGAYEQRLQEQNQELLATQVFLRRIINGSAEGIVTLDAMGRVSSWNPAAEAIYGWIADEMIGESVRRIVPTDAAAREEFQRVEDRLRRGEIVRNTEMALVHKSGRRIRVAVTASPVYDREGSPAGSVSIVRDVTALREMEARLVEKERLAAVGELAAIVAHEVRNPLAGIRGGCEILLEGYEKTDKHHEIGEEVLNQVDRLTRLVHDLLLFARPKAMDPVPTDIHVLLDRLHAVFHKDPANKEVEVRREYGCRNPVVRVDALQIEQVLLNLLVNASQAMGHKGTVTISTRTLHEAVEIGVRDTGPGIPGDRVEQIFKPFFTTRAQGTGLGLAISRKIVEAHAGTIEVESPPDGGARFAVTLLQVD
jgi:PAS domain S-box-containing protein